MREKIYNINILTTIQGDKMKKLLLLSLLLGCFSFGYAQNYYPIHNEGLYAGATRIELYGGMVLPQSNWNHDGESVDIGDIGWSAGLGFYRNVSRVIALGLDGNYAQFGDGDERADKSYYRTGAATGLVAMRVNFFPRHTTRIYIPVGIGVGHVFTRQNNEDDSHKTYNSTDLAGMLGVGLEFDIDESIIFGAEGRYYMMRTRDDFENQFGKDNIHYGEILLKFGFRF